MDSKEFLAEFGHIASAPEGVKRLREMVLQLAVQGRLVPQDATDEPASELLRRVELGRMTSSAQAKTTKRGRQVGLEGRSAAAEPSRHEPYPVPSCWAWARFDMVATIASNLVDPKANKELPHIAPDNIEKGTGRLLPYRTVAEDGVTSANHAFFAGQILYSKIRPNLAKAVMVAFDGLCSADMYPIAAHIDPRYLLIYMLSPLFISFSVRRDTRVAMPKINQVELARIPVPVAPLCEQHRIVAKVDELMALCDALEAKQQKCERLRVLTSDTALDALTSASGPEELEKHWSRIAENFGHFYDRPETVGKLRAAILQLAVQGKLVASTSNGESVASMLTRLSAAVKGKRTAKLSRPEHDLPLPKGWEWVLLEDLLACSESGWSPECDSTPRSGSEWGVLKVSAVTWGEFQPGENKKLPTHLEPRSECEVKAGDFLLSRANTAELVARSVIVPETAPAGLMMSDKIVRLQFLDDRLKAWANLVNNSSAAREYYRANATGTSDSMRNVSRRVIHELAVPLPPLDVQARILRKVDAMVALCRELESRLTSGRATAERLVTAAVSALTGTRIEDKQEMKAPKTELVSKLRLLNSPSTREHAPLAAILVRNNGELSAKALWNASGLEIDEFYRQLKVEMANDWIEEPEAAYVREVEVA